jgi:hypothetical protein
MNVSDYGVKIGIKADTGIMLLKPSTVSAVVNVVGSWFQSVIDLGKYECEEDEEDMTLTIATFLSTTPKIHRAR